LGVNHEGVSVTPKTIGRSRSDLTLPTCPICGAARVEVMGREGLQQQLTVLRCTVCERIWRELVSDQQHADEEQLA
jgi:formate dehydrogenase maturation protein FdhE